MANIFDDLDKRFGPPLVSVPMPPTDIEAMVSRVPSILLDYWRERGLLLHAGGLLHFCNPLRYDSLLPLIFSDDADLCANETALFAFSSFGELLLWNQRHGPLQINLMTGSVKARGLVRPERRTTQEIELTAQVFTFNPKIHDVKDVDLQPLNSRAVATLGHPELDECFGFFPALALGGKPVLGNVRRVSALEHFAILAQTTSFTLTD